jgi:hypothetical protein
VNWWTGDSYVTYRRNGHACMRDTIQTDPANTQGLRDALTHWAATVHGTTVSPNGPGSLLLESCAG